MGHSADCIFGNPNAEHKLATKSQMEMQKIICIKSRFRISGKMTAVIKTANARAEAKVDENIKTISVASISHYTKSRFKTGTESKSRD